jgi:hypothetical protein
VINIPIKPNNFKAFNPNYLVGFDVETFYNKKEKKNEFILGTSSVYDLKQRVEFTPRIFHDTKEMQKFLLKKRFWSQKGFITGFNAQFDLYHLPLVYSKKFNDYQRGKMYIAKYENHHGAITRFVDLRNFFSSGTLENLGEMFKSYKMKKPSWLGKRTYRNQKEKEYLEKYCYRDSKICVDVSKWLLKQFQYFKTGVCVTPSQFSFRVFQSQFLKEGIYPNKIDKQVKIFRHGYYGGRTEAFHLGTIEGKIRTYDINSFYVYAMREILLPTKAYNKVINPRKKDLVKSLNQNNLCAFANVTINSKEKIVGKFPFVDVNLKFPNGKINVNLYSSELRLLENMKYKLNSLYIAEGDYILKDFAKWVYAERNKNRDNKLMSLLYKLLGNSLYGKFAQLNEFLHRTPEYDYLYTEGVNHVGVHNEVDKSFRHIRFYFNKAYQRLLKPSKFLALPISAEITSFCRTDLYKLLVNNQDELLYCDTDSLMLRNKKLNTSKNLGGLKLEAEGNSITIFKEKLYQIFKDNNPIKTSSKGFPKRILFDKGKWGVIFLNDNCNEFKVSYPTLIKPKSAWIRYQSPFIPIKIEKTFNLLYNTKRTLLDTNFTKPIKTEIITV